MKQYVSYTENGGQPQEILPGGPTDRYFSGLPADRMDSMHGVDSGAMPFPATWLEVDLDRLSANVGQVRSVIGPEIGMIAVAKSDGYGHGLEAVAAESARSGVEMTGVGTAREAIRLRRSGIGSAVLAIYPPAPRDFGNLIRSGIDFTVTSLEAATAAGRAAERLESEARLHIQVETGMHHYGAEAAEAVELARYIAASPNLRLAGLSTHYAAADTDPGSARQQQRRFEQVLTDIARQGISPDMIHTANSAALDNLEESWDPEFYRGLMPESRVYVRPGCLLYGTYVPRRPELRTGRIATALVTHVAETKAVPAGSSVGYFDTYRTDADKRIGILPLGWGANGYFPADGQAFIDDRRVPLVGAIGANVCAVDVTDTDAAPGSRVRLFDETAPGAVTLDELARSSGTFVNRTIAMLGNACDRVYVRGGRDTAEAPASS